jgi:hypothetical protein
MTPATEESSTNYTKLFLQPVVLGPLALGLALGLLAGRCSVPTPRVASADHEHPVVIQLVGALPSTSSTAPTAATEQAGEAALLTIEAASPPTPDTAVNKHGFKRANLPIRYVWPDGCDIGGEGLVVGGYRYEFSSIYECKSQFERWERYGELWVDWKAEP